MVCKNAALGWLHRRPKPLCCKQRDRGVARHSTASELYRTADTRDRDLQILIAKTLITNTKNIAMIYTDRTWYARDWLWHPCGG